MCIVKPVLRLAVIGGLATGAAVLVAGPERLAALAGQARQAVIQKIDSTITDPVALRSQLRSLESEYPKRIASVRADLADLQAQLAELERDKSVADRVVELASADLVSMKDMLAQAEAARSDAPYAAISVRHEGRSLSLDQAYSRATQMTSTLNVYTTRAADAQRDIGFLKQQEERLAQLLAQLETERAQFQAQIWQLDGQIEMIARNDKLIEIVERRQESIDEASRFQAVSLEQITQRMSKIRAEQEARLASLTSQAETTDYEKRAKTMIDSENVARDIFKKSQETAAPVKGKTIEITPGSGATPPALPESTSASASTKRAE